MHDGFRSQLERDYAAHLMVLQATGIVRHWSYEPIEVRLSKAGRGAVYTVDFIVWFSDGRVEAHETKGYRRPADMLRIKVAADRLPWLRFYLVEKTGGGWSFTPFELPEGER